MLPYVLRTERISNQSLQALENAVTLFESIPERKDGEWTCHAMVEALHTLLERDPKTTGIWKPVHGYFTENYRHSWLINERNQDLIDPYPVACASGPMLISMDLKSPWLSLFREGGSFYDGKIPMIKHEAQQILDLYDNLPRGCDCYPQSVKIILDDFHNSHFGPYQFPCFVSNKLCSRVFCETTFENSKVNFQIRGS